MRLQEEVVTVWMSDDLINDEARADVVVYSGPFGRLPVAAGYLLEYLVFLLLELFPVPIYLIFGQVAGESILFARVVSEEASVVSFSDDDECQAELWRIGLG